MSHVVGHVISFDGWKDEFGITCSKYSVEHYTIESAFKAGAQSRLGEVVLLQEQVDELQNRIDEVLSYLGNCHRRIEIEKKYIENLLKGKENGI